MDILNDLYFSPGTQQMGILKYLIFFMLVIQLPYTGMAIVSSLLSLAYRKTNEPFSKNLSNLMLGGPWATLIFGLLPLLSLGFLLKLTLGASPVPILIYNLRLLLPVILGFILLHGFRITGSLLAGAGGAAALLFAYINFFNVMALLISPEQWPFSQSPFPIPFSITFIIHFIYFLNLSVILTGAAVLFIYFRWEEKKLPPDAPTASIHRRWGTGLILGGALALPPLLLWDLYTLPPFALSLTVFLTGAGILTILFFLSLLGLNMWRNSHTRFATTAFALALVLFAFTIIKDLQLFYNASREDLAVLKKEAAEHEEVERIERESTYKKDVTADAKLGEEIFNSRCTACHSFDRKLLGPPYDRVVPKYLGRPDDLKSYLREPQKVDPAYPAMPNPGLKEFEIESVTEFLLARYGKTEEGGQDEK